LVEGGEEDTWKRLGFVHLLAEVKFRKDTLEATKQCCLRAFHGRITILGRDHVLSHQSRYLLARIFKAQGDEEEEAKGHEILLPKEFKGTLLQSVKPSTVSTIPNFLGKSPTTSRSPAKALSDQGKASD
jgi:hypothetical protein